MGRDSALRSLPQIILVQTKTINVALIPNPIIAVIKFIPEPLIDLQLPTSHTQFSEKKTHPQPQVQKHNTR
jgi:hypothetical protein